MESVASNSSPQNHRLAQRPRTRIIPTQPFADRILRALHHNLRLLHHRESNFSVLGATGNVYTVSRLLGLPMLPESLAAVSLRERFHQLFFQESSSTTRPRHDLEIEEGRSCPICLEEMAGREERVVACGACRNPIHEECLMKWKRSSGRRSANCVICRARWKDINRIMEQDKYWNLAAYYATNHDQDDIDNADEGLYGNR
ncbi:hypothetical protein ACFX12_016929 [Malus domestica]